MITTQQYYFHFKTPVKVQMGFIIIIVSRKKYKKKGFCNFKCISVILLFILFFETV